MTRLRETALLRGLARIAAGCLLMIPLIDLWMWILARVAPGAGHPAPVAVIASAPMAAGLVWAGTRLLARRRR